MIRLQQSGGEAEPTQNPPSQDAGALGNQAKPDSSANPAALGELETFAHDVLGALIQKQIPPLPSNFEEIFEQMLNGRDIEFQKKIRALLDGEVKDGDRNIKFEKNIHLVFAKTKELLKCISGIYKNFADISDGYEAIATNTEQNVEALRHLHQLQMLADRQVSSLKTLYQQCDQILENINISTMYDLKFDVFNKRYFAHLVQEEAAAVRKYSHASSILMIALPPSVTQQLSSEQTALVVMKTIARLLLKTSRRSDMIGYIGQGIFAMLLKHSDIESSKKASERLIHLMHDTSIYLGSSEVTLNVNIGISKITGEQSANESLNHAIAALHLARKNKSPFVIYKDDDKGA